MLGVIGNKFSIGKETYSPFSAELHYFRIDKKYWSICFERIKRAGFRIISTAVPWNVHQDEKKFFDFSGLTDPRKDLIVFLELAREFGFKVILRPGPWVSGQLRNGGLPDFLYKDLKVFARDASGQELKLSDDFGAKAGYMPSYLHPNFQYHLKSFFKAFIEVTKNYIHPRGPVFMVELDHETSFGGMIHPGSADYNPDVLAKYYVEFLEETYGDIKALNSRYKEKNSDFPMVEPPRKFDDLEMKDYPKVLDWFRYREYILNTYLEVLEDIFRSYTVEPLIFRSLYFRDTDILPAFNLVPEDRAPFLGSNVFSKGNYFDLTTKARFLSAEYGFAFATSFVSGAAALDTIREEKVAPVGENTTRFYLAAGLSSGFKGLNQYMFVDREHWYGAPLHADGTVSKSYKVAGRFHQAISAIGFEDMESQHDIAVVGNRLYSWLRLTSSKKDFTCINKLLDNSLVGFCRDLMRLKLNYGVRENRDWETLKKYKLVFVPSAEVMAERDQEGIVELVKAGVSVIMCGVMPKYDENFKDCKVLSNHFRIKTTSDYHIGNIAHKNGSFPTHIYGSIRTTDDSKVKKIAMEGAKIVGVCSTRLKGHLYFFACDLASGGNHQRLSFVESILEGENMSSFLYCSDPSVDVSFQMGEKTGLLCVVAPPPGELSDGYEAALKQVIVKADLRQAGFKSPKVRLTNLFDDEEVQPMRTTLKELKDGIALDIQFPDGIIYQVAKRP
jgi:beta-galactosidase